MPVPAHDPVHTPHPLCCWISETVVEFGVGEGEGEGTGEGVGTGDPAGEGVGVAGGARLELELDKLPLPQPTRLQNTRVTDNKAILRTTDCFRGLS